MRLKHLFALAAMVVGGSAWAQTDVTSTYLVNPSFETLKATDGSTDVTVKTTLSNGLYGWEVPSMSNYQVESEASKSSTGFPADGSGVLTPTDGNYYYFNRQGWGNKNSELKTTTSQAVPAGTYYVCFDYKAADYSNNNNAGNNGTTIGVQVKDASGNVVGSTAAVRRAYSITNGGSNPGTDKYMVNAPWTQLGVIVTVDDASVLSIAIQQNMKNNGRSDIAYDNLRMYKLEENTNLTGLISNPSFETGYHANTGWTNNNSSDNGVKVNSNATYTISNNDGTYIFNSWGGSTKNYITQTIKSLPDGVYTVTATLASFSDEKIILKAGSTEKEVSATGKGNGDEVSVQVKMLAGDLVIEASNTKDPNNNNSDNSFIKADNFRLKYDRALTDQEIEDLQLPTAKATLKEKIDAIKVPTVNIGSKAFQYPSDIINNINNTLGQATSVYLDVNATLSEVNAKIDAVKALSIPSLNQPANDKKFTLMLTGTDTWTYYGRAITFIANGRKDQGLYNIQYLVEPSANYAQAFTMTYVEDNKYKMSQIDAEGNIRYISTGVPYGGNTGQIRTTTDAGKALVVEIRPTDAEGVYNLWNTEANNYIGSQDAGVYTVNSHIGFTITEAAQIPGIKIGTAGYATYVAPVNVKLPDGVTAYTATVNGEYVTLTQTATEGTLHAGTPVVVVGPETTQDALGYANTNPENATVTNGALTGVYIATEAPDNSYILANIKGVIGFYQVDADNDENPTVGANRCYLTASSPVKAFFFEDDANAVKNIEVAGDSKVVYDLQGRKVEKAGKGIYIVNGKKVMF